MARLGVTFLACPEGLMIPVCRVLVRIKDNNNHAVVAVCFQEMLQGWRWGAPQEMPLQGEASLRSPRGQPACPLRHPGGAGLGWRCGPLPETPATHGVRWCLLPGNGPPLWPRVPRSAAHQLACYFWAVGAARGLLDCSPPSGRLCFGDSLSCHAPPGADPGEEGRGLLLCHQVWGPVKGEGRGFAKDTEQGSDGTRALEARSTFYLPSLLQR